MREWLSIEAAPPSAPAGAGVPGPVTGQQLHPAGRAGDVEQCARRWASEQLGVTDLPGTLRRMPGDVAADLRSLVEDARRWHMSGSCSCVSQRPQDGPGPVPVVSGHGDHQGAASVAAKVPGGAVPPGAVLARDDQSRYSVARLISDADHGTGRDAHAVRLADSDSEAVATTVHHVGDFDIASVADAVTPRQVSDADGPAPLKRCSRCGEELPVSSFGWVSAAGRRYRAPQCRPCDAARQRERRREKRPEGREPVKRSSRSSCCRCGGPVDGKDGWRCGSCNRERVRAQRQREKAGVRFVRSADWSG
jgi:hypothetical protein